MEAKTENPLLTVAEVTLSYRPSIKPSQRPKVKKPIEAYRIFLEHWNPDKIYLAEQCYMMLLNVRGSVLGIVELSSGGISGTVVDLKMVFATALKACANAIIIAHNHPSGEVSPSEQDKSITKRLAEAGNILQIELADHLIITPEEFFSFSNEGLL